MSENDHLALLLRVNSILSSTLSVHDVLSSMIEHSIETLRAERGFVVLRKGDDWHPAAAYYVDPQRTAEGLRFSRSIVDLVVDSDQPLVATNAIEDERLSAPRSVVVQGIRSVMCAPLRWGGQIRGVVYVDSSVRAGIFNETHLRLLVAITDQASRALENAALHEQLQRWHGDSLARARDAAVAHKKAAGTEGLAQWESRAGAETLDALLGSLGVDHQTSPPQPAWDPGKGPRSRRSPAPVSASSSSGRCECMWGRP